MPIEANVEKIAERADTLSNRAGEFSAILRRFMHTRSELNALGVPMTGPQKTAAVTAANQAAADVATAATALQAAWNANSPI